MLEGERIISVRYVGSRRVGLLSTIALACYHGRRPHLSVSREQESGHMKLYFSDYFEVSEEALDQYGAFNISLVSDLPLFIDPSFFSTATSPSIAGCTTASLTTSGSCVTSRWDTRLCRSVVMSGSSETDSQGGQGSVREE